MLFLKGINTHTQKHWGNDPSKFSLAQNIGKTVCFLKVFGANIKDVWMKSVASLFS